ncbi:MAG: hypothetical protein RLZZ352_2148 [Pseudomonadota bacterium]|jgi:hypothetical protein
MRKPLLLLLLRWLHKASVDATASSGLLGTDLPSLYPNGILRKRCVTGRVQPFAQACLKVFSWVNLSVRN